MNCDNRLVRRGEVSSVSLHVGIMNLKCLHDLTSVGFQRVSARRNYEFIIVRIIPIQRFQRVSARRNYEFQFIKKKINNSFQRVSARRNYELLCV